MSVLRIVFLFFLNNGIRTTVPKGENHGPADDHWHRASDSLAPRFGDFLHAGWFHSPSIGPGHHRHSGTRDPGPEANPLIGEPELLGEIVAGLADRGWYPVSEEI